MEEYTRAKQAKEKAEDALNNFFEKAEGVGNRLLQRKKFWGGVAGYLEAIAAIITLLERDIPGGMGGGGKRRYPPLMPRISEVEPHTLHCVEDPQSRRPSA